MIKTNKDFIIIIDQKNKGKSKTVPLTIKIICSLPTCLYLQFKQDSAKKRKITYCISVGYPEALDLPTAGSF